MKNKIILVAIFSLVLAVMVSAQTTKTDYTGNWTLDVSKSKLPETMRIESMTMQVTQTDKELKIETTMKRAPRPDGDNNGGRGGMRGGGFGGDGTVTYTLDGKETSADFSSERGTGKETRKATFATDGKLSLTTTRNINGEMGSITIKTNETWELADGGKALKVTRYMETPRGATNADLYFTKTSSEGSVKTVEAPVMNDNTPIVKTISAGMINGKATKLVTPSYPSEAKKAGISGMVKVKVTIDEAGNVVSAEAVSGEPLLYEASVNAAKQAKFAPTLLSGHPVKVTGILVYNFVP